MLKLSKTLTFLLELAMRGLLFHFSMAVIANLSESGISGLRTHLGVPAAEGVKRRGRWSSGSAGVYRERTPILCEKVFHMLADSGAFPETCETCPRPLARKGAPAVAAHQLRDA